MKPWKGLVVAALTTLNYEQTWAQGWVWATIAGPWDNYNKNVTVDSADNVFVVNSFYTPGGVQSYTNTWINKFDGSGNELWSRLGGGSDRAVDRDGNLFVAGTMSFTSGGSNKAVFGDTNQSGSALTLYDRCTYASMFLVSLVASILFLGAWHSGLG